MRSINRAIIYGVFAITATFSATKLWAHGFVGDRFFPPTISTDDPFATDELSLPAISYFANANDDGPPTYVFDASMEFDKEILPRLALGISDDYQIQKSARTTTGGWDNLTLSAKYELWENEPHEAIISAGLIADIGGTGTKSIADSFSTFIPTFYFGKGFGDLPDSLSDFKPLAITGTLGQTFPTSAAAPNAFQWGFAVEYSLPYLQQSVRDIGLPEPLKNMIPLVEFNLSTTENRGPSITTGTIDPGVLWETPDFQIGVEAIIPINGKTGPHVGAIVNVQIFIDDIFPSIFGHPLFGN